MWRIAQVVLPEADRHCGGAWDCYRGLVITALVVLVLVVAGIELYNRRKDGRWPFERP